MYFNEFILSTNIVYHVLFYSRLRTGPYRPELRGAGRVRATTALGPSRSAPPPAAHAAHSHGAGARQALWSNC